MKGVEEDDQSMDNLSTTKSLPEIDGHPANDSENYNDKNGAGNNAENDDNPSRTKSVRDIDGYPANDSDNDNDKNEHGNDAENGDNRSRTQSVRDIDGYPANDSEGDNDKNESGKSTDGGETFENHEQNAPSVKEYAIETSHLQARCEVCNKELQRTKNLPKRPKSI